MKNSKFYKLPEKIAMEASLFEMSNLRSDVDKYDKLIRDSIKVRDGLGGNLGEYPKSVPGEFHERDKINYCIGTYIKKLSKARKRIMIIENKTIDPYQGGCEHKNFLYMLINKGQTCCDCGSIYNESTLDWEGGETLKK